MQQRKALSAKIEESIIQAIIRKWEKEKDILYLPESMKELYIICNVHFAMCLGYFPNLITPQSFNEKSTWCKLFDQSLLTVRCTDKILVKEYIESQLGQGYTPKTYQIGKCFADIDFNSLPDTFVLKTNHDCGTVFPVLDYRKFDRESGENMINSALTKKYGWNFGEWPYSFVRPRAYVEEYIHTNSTCPTDYKFQTAGGKVRFCNITMDRSSEPKEIVVDRDGNDIGFKINSFARGDSYEIPDNWYAMVTAAETLSRPFQMVRVDMYALTDQKFMIGELTFYPAGGCFPGIGQSLVGDLLPIDLKQKKSFVVPDLKLLVE